MKNKACSNCKKSGFDSEFLFCPYCGNDLFLQGKCGECGHQNPPESKYCQECGSKLSLEPVLADEPEYTILPITNLEDVPASGITIEFGYSTSANFDKALKIAREFDSYIQYGEDRKALHRITIDPSQIEETTELHDYVGGWKSAKLYIDGEDAQSGSVYGFTWCYRQRKSNFKPEYYCFGYENEHDFNLWGCNQARMPFRGYADWFSYGEWIGKKGDWKFDKERILHKLQIELFSVRFCPAFNPDLVEDVLQAMPDVVNPNKDKNWKFVEDWGGDDISAGLVITREEQGYKEKVVMKGVAPKAGAISQIAKSLNLRLPKMN